MPRGGHNKKPYLQAVREGTARRGDDRAGVVLPPTALVEPDWKEKFPGRAVGERRRLRERCHELWTGLAPVLAASVGLVYAQQEVLIEFVLCVARIEQCERQLSQEGLIVEGQRGQVRNPLITVANGYRTQLRSMQQELGLTPGSAARLVRPYNDPNEEDPFDD